MPPTRRQERSSINWNFFFFFNLDPEPFAYGARARAERRRGIGINKLAAELLYEYICADCASRKLIGQC